MLHLSALDIARTRIAPPLGPLGETLLACEALANGRRGRQFERWRTDVSSRLIARDRALASFLWLSPGVGFDLFTVIPPTRTITEGLDTVLDIDREVFATEADGWVRLRARAQENDAASASALASRASAALRAGNVESRRRLCEQLARIHEAAVAPSWAAIDIHLDVAQASLGLRLAREGLEAVLREFGFLTRWTGTTLDLFRSESSAGSDDGPWLNGRGMVIVPSFFALKPALYTPADASAPVMLIAPSGTSWPELSLGAPPVVPGELLGATRTEVLAAIGRHPHTTTALSREVGISISGASQHAAVLRRANLVCTKRDGGHVLHTLTDLGRALLRQLS